MPVQTAIVERLTPIRIWRILEAVLIPSRTENRRLWESEAA